MSESQLSVKDVLIADDDNDDYKILTSAINDLNLMIVVSRAENGEILLKILNENIPDLLFLDVLMPIRDGKDCLKAIRADHRFDALPIIMYSSLKDLETIHFCYRERSNLFFYKPNTYSDLLATLSRIFSIDWKKMMYYPPLSQYVLNQQ